MPLSPTGFGLDAYLATSPGPCPTDSHPMTVGNTSGENAHPAEMRPLQETCPRNAS